MDELFDKLPSMLKWLTHEWFRLVEPFDRENRNHGRAATLSIWKLVQDAFADWGWGELVEKPPRRNPQPDMSKLVKMAMGCLTSAVAAGGVVVATADELLNKIVELLAPLGADARKRLMEKIDRLEFSGTLRDLVRPEKAAEEGGNRCAAFDDWNASADAQLAAVPF